MGSADAETRGLRQDHRPTDMQRLLLEGIQARWPRIEGLLHHTITYIYDSIYGDKNIINVIADKVFPNSTLHGEPIACVICLSRLQGTFVTCR